MARAPSWRLCLGWLAEQLLCGADVDAEGHVDPVPVTLHERAGAGVVEEVVSEDFGRSSIRMTADEYGDILAPDRKAVGDVPGEALWMSLRRPAFGCDHVPVTTEAPSAHIVSVERTGDTTLIALRLPDGLTPPLAPASLISPGETWQELVHVDAVIDEHNGVTVFRTEQIPDRIAVGDDVVLQQWWLPTAHEAVTDVNRRWRHLSAPVPEDHEHCLLCGETIEDDGAGSQGWESNGDWICDDCHQRFIVEDHLGVRG